MRSLIVSAILALGVMNCGGNEKIEWDQTQILCANWLSEPYSSFLLSVESYDSTTFQEKFVFKYEYGGRAYVSRLERFSHSIATENGFRLLLSLDNKLLPDEFKQEIGEEDCGEIYLVNIAGKGKLFVENAARGNLQIMKSDNFQFFVGPVNSDR